MNFADPVHRHRLRILNLLFLEVMVAVGINLISKLLPCLMNSSFA